MRRMRRLDPLDWYARMKPAHQQSAYALAWRLCGNQDTAVRQIIPIAVDIAYKDLRFNRNRRDRYNGRGYKIWLSDPELLQIGILEAAKQKDVAPRSDPWLPLPYIAHLTLCTLPRSSFYVAVGFGRLLTGERSPEVLHLYELLDSSGCRSRDEGHARSVLRTISGEMLEQFRERMPAAEAQLALTQIPKKPDDALYRALAAVVPWESSHLPETYEDFLARQQ